MKKKKYIRITPLLENISPEEIRRSAEYAIANGYRAGDLIGTLVANVIHCIQFLEVDVEGERFSCWVAPMKGDDEPTVFVGHIDGDFTPIGKLSDLSKDLFVPNYFYRD